ncbi:hypothetical protein BX616_008772 [Lobosporangium transversale]|uniref:Kinase-like domain-containing protein n=1 Tax=Lobosporangium transversale TaxID=64571 RepID=A0A1Y2GFQ5_9FUNG|nr:kinase-like domain-containing protein [Lobosporangium transversale]KAF9918441.1 hypothetical protein BX616_008772 [Lobosporangium transversale]ORZ09661.1 kinase-like domain-containing protein [Lobosporangium transversale]|eukprot:XP_021878931.1 kinase-like domain-containing protein [Lobosporangium transversale]
MYPSGQNYSTTQTADMAPGLTHSAMTTRSDVMDLDSQTFETHRYARPEDDRLVQQHVYQQQIQQTHQQNFLQPQPQPHLPSYPRRPSFSQAASPGQLQQLQQQLHQQYQGQQQTCPQDLRHPVIHYQHQPPHGQVYNQLHPMHHPIQQTWQATETHSITPATGQGQSQTAETQMPSLEFSDVGNSTTSRAMNDNAHASHLVFAQPLPSPSMAPKDIVAVTDIDSVESTDSDYFLASVLNVIRPVALQPVPVYDYHSEFTQRQWVTKGGNGEIRRAFWPLQQTIVILKRLIDTKQTTEKLAKLFDKEVEVMNQCRNHENIVQFYGVAIRNSDDERNGERFMIMQFYQLGDLVKLMEMPNNSFEAPTLNDKIYLALDIAMGLDHLFKCGFHHGDLHPKNILIDKRRDPTPQQGRYLAKLTDFGLRRLRDSKKAFSSQQFGGVWQFIAPERMCKNRPRYDVRCDIFALGVLYWFIMAGRYPFKDPSLFTPGARENRVEGTPDWYHDVYTKAWDEDPNNRQQDLEEIIQVFRYNLGIRTPPPHFLNPSYPHSHHPHQHQLPQHANIPLHEHHNCSTFQPSYVTHDGQQHPQYHHTGSSAGGSTIRGSPLLTPASMLTPTSLNGPASPHPPSPLFSNATLAPTSSMTRSSNPNHPHYRKPSVPNGQPTSIFRT